MADKSLIEWTDATWNPITGCSIVDAGCTNCYAMALAGSRLRNIPSRAGLTRVTGGRAKWTGEVRFNEHWLDQPLRWRAPRRIFVCAHGDLFHESVPDEWIDRVFAVMALAPQHTFQVLTKRPEQALVYLAQRDERGRPRYWPIAALMAATGSWSTGAASAETWPLPNVWLGTSASDQASADLRIPPLLDAPAAVRFLSAEPLLGEMRLDMMDVYINTFEDCGGHPDPYWPPDTQDALWFDALRGRFGAEARDPRGNRLGDIDIGLRHLGGKLDWVIVGGESGPRARPMHPDWARSLRDQCVAAGVAFHFKQWGEWAPRRPAEEADLLDARKAVILRPDGVQSSGLLAYGPAAWVMDRSGKARAGRLLDGRTWDQMPGVAHGR